MMESKLRFQQGVLLTFAEAVFRCDEGRSGIDSQHTHIDYIKRVILTLEVRSQVVLSVR